jgi:hypothetical protein
MLIDSKYNFLEGNRRPYHETMLTYVENQLKTVKKSWKTVENNTFTCRRYHLQRIAAQDDTRNITKAQLYTTAKYTRLSFLYRGCSLFRAL